MGIFSTFRINRDGFNRDKFKNTCIYRKCKSNMKRRKMYTLYAEMDIFCKFKKQNFL